MIVLLWCIDVDFLLNQVTRCLLQAIVLRFKLVEIDVVVCAVHREHVLVEQGLDLHVGEASHRDFCLDAGSKLNQDACGDLVVQVALDLEQAGVCSAIHATLLFWQEVQYLCCVFVLREINLLYRDVCVSCPSVNIDLCIDFFLSLRDLEGADTGVKLDREAVFREEEE